MEQDSGPIWNSGEEPEANYRGKPVSPGTQYIVGPILIKCTHAPVTRLDSGTGPLPLGLQMPLPVQDLRACEL